MSNRTAVFSALKGNRMKNVKKTQTLSRSINLAVAIALVISFAPKAWSEDMPSDEAAPPMTSEMADEGAPAPSEPILDSGMGSPEAEPAVAEKPVKKAKKKHAAKKAKKKKAKKNAKKKAKKKNKKKKRSNY
jgi:hypothetical protein